MQNGYLNGYQDFLILRFFVFVCSTFYIIVVVAEVGGYDMNPIVGVIEFL